MRQTVKSLVFVRLSVNLSVNGRNFDSILTKFCTVIQGPKSMIEFVWDKNLITPSPILPLFKKCIRPTNSLKRYNSVP